MKSIFNKLIAVMAAAAMLLCLAACAKAPSGDVPVVTPKPLATPRPTSVPVDKDKVSTAAFSVNAVEAYGSELLPAEVKAQLENGGILLNGAQLTLPKGGMLESVFRVLELCGIPVVAEDAEAGRVITSIKGVANGSCGDESRWMIVVNGDVKDGPIDDIVVNDGDVITFYYSLNGTVPGSVLGAE